MSNLKIGLDLDPTLQRVIAIAILMFVTAFVIPLQVIFTQGRMPTEAEIAASLGIAIVVMCEYLLTFLKTGETKSE